MIKGREEENIMFLELYPQIALNLLKFIETKF